jgi:hypothetical protein
MKIEEIKRYIVGFLVGFSVGMSITTIIFIKKLLSKVN